MLAEATSYQPFEPNEASVQLPKTRQHPALYSREVFLDQHHHAHHTQLTSFPHHRMEDGYPHPRIGRRRFRRHRRELEIWPIDSSYPVVLRPLLVDLALWEGRLWEWGRSRRRGLVRGE